MDTHPSTGDRKIESHLLYDDGRCDRSRERGLRRMVVNAVLWGFELEIPARTDVRFVDPFALSPYTFKRYRRGLTPADHALGKTLREGSPRPPEAAKNK